MIIGCFIYGGHIGSRTQFFPRIVRLFMHGLLCPKFKTKECATTPNALRISSSYLFLIPSAQNFEKSDPLSPFKVRVGKARNSLSYFLKTSTIILFPRYKTEIVLFFSQLIIGWLLLSQPFQLF